MDTLIQVSNKSGPGITRYQGRSRGESVPQLYCPAWQAPVIPTDLLSAAKRPRSRRSTRSGWRSASIVEFQTLRPIALPKPRQTIARISTEVYIDRREPSRIHRSDQQAAEQTSQAELCRLTGIPRASMCRFLSGTDALSASNLDALAAGLGLRVEEIK